MVRTYGLRPGEYAELLAKQGGKCAICRKVPRKRYLAVDHDHATGKIRGLLCFFCNSALGVFEFSPATARRAAVYLFRIANDVPYAMPDETEKVKDDLPF